VEGREIGHLTGGGMSANQPAAPQRPIVIQTLWRTCGTYLAFMLRERNQTALFYEPLHEDYSKFTFQQWNTFARQGAGIPRGHPRKAFHYLTDFPFVAGAGVLNHSPEFAWRPFVMAADAVAPDLQAYLQGLIEHAAAEAKTPLFKFCRGFLRQPWLAEVLAPRTIYLVRRPGGMLKSCRRFNSGAYFFSSFIRILCLNKAEPAFAPVYDHLLRLNPELERLSAQALYSENLHELTSPETMQDVVLFFWAIGLAAHCCADELVLDANEFGWSRESKARAARAIGEHTGLSASFDDAMALDPSESELLGFNERPRFAAYTREAIALLAPKADCSGLSPDLARQLDALVGKL
jgi:hypothetical protein